MGKFLRRVFSEGIFQIVGGVLSWLYGLPFVMGAIAAVTAYFGQWSWLAIYLSTLGAFTLGCIATVCIIWVVARLSIFRSVNLIDVLPYHAVINDGVIDNLTLRGVVENKSQRDVYVVTKRTVCVIQDRTQSDVEFPALPILIVAGKKHSFNCPPVSGIDVTKEARGHIDVELTYGPSEENQKYRYECKCAVSLLLSQPAPTVVDIKVANAIKHETHARR